MTIDPTPFDPTDFRDVAFAPLPAASVTRAVFAICNEILWSIAGYGKKFNWLKFIIPERRNQAPPFFLIIGIVWDSVI
jgi:hypothetical protein